MNEQTFADMCAGALFLALAARYTVQLSSQALYCNVFRWSDNGWPEEYFFIVSVLVYFAAVHCGDVCVDIRMFYMSTVLDVFERNTW